MQEEDQEAQEAQIEEALPAFVLGALEPDEMILVERYLRERASATLLARLRALEETTGQLGRAVPSAPLSPTVKESLMRRVRADAAHHAPGSRGATPGAGVRRWSFSGWMRPLSWAVSGALVACLVLFLGFQPSLVTTRAENARLAQQVALLDARRQSLEDDNAQLRLQLATRQQQLLTVAHSQQQVGLSGTEAAPDSMGTLYLGVDGGVLILEGLPALTDGQTYQLWWITAEQGAVPATLLTVTESELTMLGIPLPEAGLRLEAVGISIEPQGGSQQPTGPVVLIGERG